MAKRLYFSKEKFPLGRLARRKYNQTRREEWDAREERIVLVFVRLFADS